MGRKKWRYLGAVLAAVMLLPMTAEASSADGSNVVYEGYTYDFYGNAKESPAAFVLERIIDAGNMNGTALSGVDDVCTSKDGRIFMVDSVESRMNVLDGSGNFIQSVKLLRNPDGKIALDENGNQLVLTNPEGIWVHEKEQEIYIADTGAGRIVVLNLNDYSLKRIIGKPENLSGDTVFKPSKITVDLADRIYVVIQSSYEGILGLTREGEFSGYYGVNVPVFSFMDYFWKSIASDEQKAQMSKTYAPAFNNITLDGEGFVMAVTYDMSARDVVFRLNSKGENVLREKENLSVVGDIWHLHQDDPFSQFVDIAVTDYGTYAVLDRTKGRVFLYNFDGELLNVFGSTGNLKGEYKEPTAIAWLGNRLVTADKTLKCIYILAPTAFGQAVLEGNESYYFGRWDEALISFEKAVALNANYEVAYSGIGKNYLMKDDYKTAMYYFKLGNNREFYSKAYNGYRGQWLEDHFGVIMGILALLIAAIVWSEIMYHRNRGIKKPKEVNTESKLYYIKYSLIHPFDAFYEMRFRGRGSLLFAVISLVLFGILQCVSCQYTGFVMNMVEVNSMNSLSVFATWVSGFVLFIVSNWAVTTLLNGKGGIADITEVIGYSLIPVEVTMILRIVLSNFVILEEAMIVNVIAGVGIVWFLFMVVAGLCVIHEYSFGKTVASVLLTFVAAAIIIFLGVLFFTLVEQMVTFVMDVAKEFIRRM